MDVKVRALAQDVEKGDIPAIGSMTKSEAQAAEFLPKLEDFGFSAQEIS